MQNSTNLSEEESSNYEKQAFLAENVGPRFSVVDRNDSPSESQSNVWIQARFDFPMSKSFNLNPESSSQEKTSMSCGNAT